MKLFPQDNRFFDLFTQQVDVLGTIARELEEMLSQFDRLADRQARVKDLEHECDALTLALITAMHGTFVTPLDKEDIANLASGIDTVADLADAAALRVVLYRIPESTQESRELARILHEAVRQLVQGVRMLKSPRQRKGIPEVSREIHRLENESDAVHTQAVGKLLNAEGADPIHVIKWKEIYDHLERAVDQCEDVANVLEGIHIKYA